MSPQHPSGPRASFPPSVPEIRCVLSANDNGPQVELMMGLNVKCLYIPLVMQPDIIHEVLIISFANGLAPSSGGHAWGSSSMLTVVKVLYVDHSQLWLMLSLFFYQQRFAWAACNSHMSMRMSWHRLHYWPFVWGIHWVPVDSPHKEPVR